MAAPKGNKFWMARSSHGPKPKFENPEDLWNGCVEYFDWIAENPLLETRPFHHQGIVVLEDIPKMRAMTLDGLTHFLDIGLDTWHRYRGRDDLREVAARVDRIIREQKFSGAAAELLNPNIIARDLGLADKSELKHEGEMPLQVQVYLPDNGMGDGEGEED